MSEWKELNEESKSRWEQNAYFWDDYMGEKSNRYHRELIRPYTEELLHIDNGTKILDIACGNGNFSRRLIELGADVTAFDYSAKMIEKAKLRTENIHNITYHVIDATDYKSIVALGEQQFDHAVANMALMDIADVSPLARALSEVLKPGGTFIFSITHPCFQTPKMRKVQETEDVSGQMTTRNSIQIFDYLNAGTYEAMGINNQPTPHIMFHRTLTYYMNLFFASGFVLDGFSEPSFKKEEVVGRVEWCDIPPIAIFRFKNMG